MRMLSIALAVLTFTLSPPVSAAEGAGLTTIAGPPTAWGVWNSRGATGLLLRSTQDLTRVGVVHSDLTENKTKRHLISPAFFLAPVDDKCSGEIRQVDLKANQLLPVRLCVDSEMPGAFSGSIRIAPAGGEPSSALSTNIYFTSAGAWIFGTVLLIVGAALAFFVTRYASNRIARAQALLPLALLRERIQPSVTTLQRSAPQFASELAILRNDALELQDRLSEKSADAALFVPPRFPMFGPGTARSSEFSTFLNSADVSVTLLNIITRNGIDRVLDLAPLVGLMEAARAMSELEAIWIARRSAVDAATEVRRIVTALNTSPVRAAAASAGRFIGETLEFTPERIQTQIRSFSAISFSLVSLGTILAGFVALIANNPGFGLPVDYLTCFTTGFAVPTAAGVLASPMMSNTTGVSVSSLRRDF